MIYEIVNVDEVNLKNYDTRILNNKNLAFFKFAISELEFNRKEYLYKSRDYYIELS